MGSAVTLRTIAPATCRRKSSTRPVSRGRGSTEARRRVRRANPTRRHENCRRLVARKGDAWSGRITRSRQVVRLASSRTRRTSREKRRVGHPRRTLPARFMRPWFPSTVLHVEAFGDGLLDDLQEANATWNERAIDAPFLEAAEDLQSDWFVGRFHFGLGDSTRVPVTERVKRFDMILPAGARPCHGLVNEPKARRF